MDPRGKGSHGGTRKVYRAGSLPPGEEARQGVPVRKAHPWRNKQSAHRAERLPLGNCYTYGEQPRKAGKATAKAMS